MHHLMLHCFFSANQFDTLEQVQTALRRAGLESSNLIIGMRPFYASGKLLI